MRREFITLLGGAAVAWPLAARAQQPGDRRDWIPGCDHADDLGFVRRGFSAGLRELG